VNNIVRKRVEILGKLIIGFGLIIFLVNFVKPNSIVETFKKADSFFLGVAILLLPLNLFLQYYKWEILCNKLFNVQSPRLIWLSLFYGISGGIFTPMKSGEYIARALPLKEVKAFDVVLATAVDKIIPLFFVITLGGSFFIVFLRGIFLFSNSLMTIIIILYLFLILVPLTFLFNDGRRSIKIRDKFKKVKFINKLIERVSFIRTIDKKIFIKHVSISFLYHLTFTIQMTLLLSAFSGEFDFMIYFFAANLIIFTQIIIPPIALGELGIREGAAVFYLQHLGYTSVVGFNAALSLFTINLLIPSIIGLLLLLKRN